MIEDGRTLLYRSLAASWSLCAVATRRHSGLSTREIALIKAMLGLGKKAGFHSGRIQSYFSRPDRNVNPARIYEIRDGTLGPDIAPASETELHDFLLRFESIPTADDQVHKPFPRLPTPAYIGVLEGRIRILPRNLVIVEEQDDYGTREKLLQEQRRIVAMLSDAWGKFQVEQRLEEHLKEYGRLAETDHRSLNIFALDTEFNTVNKALGSDTGGLGQKGEIQWERFTQNHIVLCNFYPEMRDYRAALASIRSDLVLPQQYAAQIVQELLTEGASEFVGPEVPTLIQERLGEDTRDDPEAKNKRLFDVEALVTRASGLLYSVTHHLPRLAATADAGHTLWNRVWVPLREFLRHLDLL